MKELNPKTKQIFEELARKINEPYEEARQLAAARKAQLQQQTT